MNDDIPVSVLIVDDNPGKLIAITAALEGMDIQIVTATSGLEALHQLLDQDFSVLLLDVNMPIMDGFETAKLIRQRPRSEHLPIIFITAERLSEDAKLQGYELGAVDYLWSPVLPQILRAKVATFVDLYRFRHRLAASEEKFRKISEASHDAIIMMGADKCIKFWNPAATRLFGYTQEEALGQEMHPLLAPQAEAAFECGFAHFQSTGTGPVIGKTLELSALRKDGVSFPVEVTVSALQINDGWSAIGIFRDITEHKLNEAKIHKLAFYDALTQLPNRRLLNDRLDQAMAASKRSGRYGAVMFVDLDNFKPLNDTHGHSMGDLLLIEVAQRITRCLREMDTVARFGGDEFVVLLSELDVDKAASIREANIVAEKIRAALAEVYRIKTPCQQRAALEHRCTSSIGVVLFINHETTADNILRSADKAMYQAKNGGRNQVCYIEPEAKI